MMRTETDDGRLLVEDPYVYRAMRAGASGFLLKDANRGQLINAVHTVSAGDALLAPSITRRVVEELCRRPPGNAAADAAGRLSQREVEVARLIAKGSPTPRQPHGSTSATQQ
jgi:DNA-binding NarL/FixJ family response regulator